MPSESGSRRAETSFTSPVSTPAWIAAPMATTSSGFTPRWGSLPKKLFTSSCTFGMRIEPPTSTTSSMSPGETPASLQAVRTGSSVRWIRSSMSCSNFARESRRFRCFGPDASAVMYGRLISVSATVESSIFAFSAASFRRCIAIGSLERSTPWSFLNSSTR